MKRLMLLLVLVLAACTNHLADVVAGDVPWRAERVYTAGERCRADPDKYVSLQDGNVGNYPPASPEWWEKEEVYV